MRATPAPSVNRDEQLRSWVRLQDAATYLSSATALRQLIQSGQLPVYRIGTLSLYRVRQADLDALLAPADPVMVLAALRQAEEAEEAVAADELAGLAEEPAPSHEVFDQGLIDDTDAGTAG